MSGAEVTAAAPDYFVRDVARINAVIEREGALVHTEDGAFVDPSKLPADLASTYRRLLQHGCANGWMR